MTEQAQGRPWSRRLPSRYVVLAVVIALCGVAYVQKEALFSAAGSFLVKVDDLEPAEVIVVLAGDGSGERIMKAVDLARQDLAPKILVSGPQGHYGYYESDLAIAFAVKHGAPAEIFDALPMDVDSTMEEASAVHAELRRRGIKKAIIVTSNFHTRRAGDIFRQRGGGETTYLIASAPNPFFKPDDWWQSRAGKKVFLLEALKTMNSWVE